MSPHRAVIAVVLLVAAPVVAGIVIGIPPIGTFAGGPGEDTATPEPFVDVQTSTPGADDRQTDAVTETPASEDAAQTSQPADGTVTATETATPDSTPTPTPADEPAQDRQDDSDNVPDDPPADDTNPSAPEQTEQPTDQPPADDTPTATPTPESTDAPPADDGSDDEGADDGNGDEAWSDAQQIRAGSTVSDDVEMGDTNWYAIDVERGETLSVLMEGSPEELSVAILDADGQVVDQTEVSTPDPTVFGAPISESGTYYVRVDAGDGFGGSYDLTAQTAGPDNFDPNDGRARALPVANGDDTSATLTEGESDWYAIQLPANTTITASVTVEGHALGRDVRVDILDENGDAIPGSESAETSFHPSIGSNTATTTANATSEGVYYVRVTPADLDGHADYTVTVDSE